MSKILTSKSGRVTLEISDDGMSAWMTIHRSTKLINEMEILDLIDESGIQYGFEQAVNKVRKDGLQKEYDQAFPIALCEYKPQDHQLKYYFDPDNSIDPNHEFTPEYLNSWTCVEAGTIIADSSINLFENEGSVFNIFGTMLQYDSFDRTQSVALAGQNVSYDDKTNRYIAKATGFPYLDTDGRICILDTIIINHALEFNKDPFRCPVSMVINSSVNNGEIVCNGDVTINGNVTDAVIICESDLTVNGDIINCNKPGLHVKGSLSCNNITDSRVITKAHLSINGSVMFSHLVADKGIQGSDNSEFISGNAQSCGNIEFGTIGSLDKTETDLEITISPYYKTLLMIKTKELISLKQQNDVDPEEISILKDTITDLENMLDTELSGFLQRARTDKFHIIAHHDIYPFSSLRVLKHAYTVKNHQKGIKLYEKD